MHEASMSVSRSACRVASAAHQTANKRDVRRVAELSRRRDEGLRKARVAMDLGDWTNAARWEERAIVSDHAIAVLYDHRFDE